MNDKISNGQIKKLLVFDMMSISMIIVPGIAGTGAGQDGLIAIIAGSLAALVYGFFFLFVSGKIQGEYIEFSTQTMGTWMTFLFGLLYLIKIIFSCWFALSLFSTVINDTLLPETNIKVILLPLILLSVLSAAKGVETRARIAEIFFFIVLFPLILLCIFGLKGIEITNLFPLFITPRNEIIYTGYGVLLTYSAVEILLFVLPNAAGREKERLFCVGQAVVITAVLNTVLFILVVGLLGLAGAERQLKASIMVMQILQIPGGFAQRQDAIMLTIWLISIFSILSAYFHILSKITNELIPVNQRHAYLIFYGVLLFGLANMPLPLEIVFAYYGKYMAYVGFPQSVCIPLLIILTAAIRSRRRTA